MHISTGKKDGLPWYRDFTINFGEKPGSRYISFFFPLHSGWRSYPSWMPGGWEYYEPAILTGRLYENKGKWHLWPRMLVPAKLVDLLRLRKKQYRELWRYDRHYKKHREALDALSSVANADITNPGHTISIVGDDWIKGFDAGVDATKELAKSKWEEINRGK